MYKPRLGFAINMERQLNERGYGVPLRAKINALDFGFGFDGRPIMIVGGQDVYTPIFRPDEVAYIAGAGTSRNTFLIIAGGVLATGAIVALASSSNGNGNDRDSNGRDRDGDSDDNG
ncbi:MAG: hypothetical protein COA47_11410 [Robiginitomaculum sp.]|nr:MAG: hypothetical protein COA47_11410 [Robiginitomaculum sp.]